MSTDTADQLRGLFGASALRELDVVRAQLLANPKALDNRPEPVEIPHGK